MRRYFNHARSLATSGTAKDTYLLFGGNIVSSFLAFLFTVIAARGLSVSDFGIFSAINNLVTIVGSVSDLGISAGLIKYVALYSEKGKSEKAKEVLKAALILRFFTISIFILSLLIAPKLIANKFLATDDISLVYWAAALSLVIMIWNFFPTIFQAYKRFKEAIGVDLSLGVTRDALLAVFLFFGVLTIRSVMTAFIFGGFVAGALSMYLIGKGFLRKKPAKKLYKKLLKFSGWVGVNRAVSALSSRLDVQMIAVYAGATVTGHYSIASRLALFIVLITSSFATVLAPRLSSFEDKQKEKVYILKAAITTLPIIAGTILWIVIAKPFILILFGSKYLPAVPIFRALAAAMIPFILTAPSVTAIIYSMKKPVYIGIFSFYQLAVLFFANLALVPRIGAYGPTVAFAIVNSSLAIYTWVIVIRHYWMSNQTQKPKL